MKKVKTGALLLGLLLVLTGCGKNEAKDVDPSVLADTLRNAITFQDELEAVDAAAMGRMYEVDEADIEAFKVYTGTGATAEEIAVFKAKDEQAAGASTRRCRHGWKTRKPRLRIIIRMR